MGMHPSNPTNKRDTFGDQNTNAIQFDKTNFLNIIVSYWNIF